MSILFISDLHLDESRPHITRAFFDFLDNKASKAEALYILGDFFEVWIGDDDLTRHNRSVIEALKKLSDSGVQLYIMHGNRDFLLGRKFCSLSGATLLEEGSVVDIYGQPVVLLHGDSLCSDDIEYQKFRNKIRQPWRKFLLRHLPLSFRKKVASQWREKSKKHNANKASNIMDVNPAEVLRALDESNTRIMIHGHTHRPCRHPLAHKGKTAERIVLGDWHQQLWYLEASRDGEFELLAETIPPQA